MSRTFLALSAFLIAQIALAGDPITLARSDRPATQPATQPALPTEEPVLQLWSDAVYLLGSKASPRFVLWADGTLVQRLPNGSLYRGQLSPADVTALMAKLREAGLFDTPLHDTHVRPDGGSQTIGARDGDKRVRLSYDGLYDDPGAMAQIGPNASPSREQVNTFLRRWYVTIRAIHETAPARLERIDQEVKLPYPATQPAK